MDKILLCTIIVAIVHVILMIMNLNLLIYLLCLILNVGVVMNEDIGIHHALRKEIYFVLVAAINTPLNHPAASH